MNLTNKITTGIMALAVGIGLAPKYAKADFFEAIQTPTKGQVQLISTQSNANRFIDNNANEKEIDIGRIVNNLTLKFKDKGVFAGVTIPHVSAENNSIGSSVSGLGDIILEAGPYFNINKNAQRLSLLPTLAVKTPSGNYDANRKLNAGTGQTDLSSMIRGTYLNGKYIADSGIGFTHRFSEPSDIVNARLTLGYGNKKVKAGIENIGIFGLDGSKNIKTSAQVVAYTKKWNITARYGVDSYSRGYQKGHFYGFTARRNL